MNQDSIPIDLISFDLQMISKSLIERNSNPVEAVYS